jgi:hypothetical protein
MELPHMLQKVFAIAKRLLVGYGFLLSLVLIGITLAWPFVFVSGMGLGLIPLGELPLPRNVTRIVSVLSVGITLVVGLRWLCFPSQRLDTWLANLHSNLLHSRKWLLLRFVGILVALPLFGFILSPCAIVWLGLEEVSYRLYQTSVLSGCSYRTIAFVTGFVWLGIAIGRLCPPGRAIRRIVLRCQLIFIDWVLEPFHPQAARREREKLHQRSCQIDG